MKKIFLLLAIVTLVVYFNSLNNSFVWDDHFLVEGNDFIKNAAYIPQIFTTDLYHSHAEKNAAPHSNFYRPIQALSFMADYHIWGPNPFGFHLGNVLLHMANGILVFMAVFLICRSRPVSLFTGILFLVHPVQTGAVSYISGRADLLACFFILTSFILYAGFKRLTSYFLSLAAFAAALLSKEVAIIFPLLLIIYDVVYRRIDSLSGALKKYSAYLAVVAAYVILRLSVFNFTPENKISVFSGDITTRIMTMWRALTEYIALLIYPSNLHMERGVSAAAQAFTGDTALAAIGFISALFLMAAAYKRSRTAFFGIAWFLTFLLPVSNIVPLNAFVAEHWLYIPSIGFFLAISVFFAQFVDKKAGYILAVLVFAAIAMFYGLKTVDRNKDWKDDMSIYSATLKYSPGQPKVYYNLGTAYGEKGSWEKAAKCYSLAIEAGMEKSEAYTNRAISYANLGRLKEAEGDFRRAIALEPGNPFAHNGLGGLLEKAGLKNEAIDEYEKALAAHPDFYDANMNLGVLYGESGEDEKAAFYFEKAFSIRKDEASYHNLCRAREKAGLKR